MTESVRPPYILFCERWLSGMSRALVVAAMLSLVVMTALIALQVVSRNFFDLGLPWADELARFTGLMTVFFTVPLLQYHGQHIAVDIVSSRLRGLAARTLAAVNEAIVLAFCVLLLISFASFFESAAFFSTPAIGMPNWVFYSPALIGVAACTLVAALRLVLVAIYPAPEGTAAVGSTLQKGNPS